MTGIRSYLAVLCALLMIAPAGGFAADPPQAEFDVGSSSLLKQRSTARLSPGYQPPNNLANSARLESLLRAGNLYLSLAGRHRPGAGKQSGYRHPALRSAVGRRIPAAGAGGRFRARRFHQCDGRPVQRFGIECRHHARHERQRDGRSPATPLPARWARA